MNRRMIDCGMWQNERFAEMPMGARLLQIGMINHADDQGRLKANPAWLRAQIFPYDSMEVDMIQSWLEMMSENETIILYTVAGKQYAQLVNWWKYQSLQYAQPSQFPRPDGWQDRIRKTVTKGFIATCNWVTVDGTPLADTCDMDGNTINTGGKQSPIQRPPTTPSSPSANGHSPESSPESSPEGTILTKLNRIELNKIETKTDAAGADSDSGDSSLSLSGWQEVMRAYESNIGSFTAMSSELVRASTEEHGATVVVDAITEAVKQNVRKWSYVDGILKRWKANGRNGESPKPVKPPPRQAQKITIFNQYTNQYEEKLL